MSRPDGKRQSKIAAPHWLPWIGNEIKMEAMGRTVGQNERVMKSLLDKNAFAISFFFFLRGREKKKHLRGY